MKYDPDEEARTRFSHTAGAAVRTVQVPLRADVRQKLEALAIRDETSLASVARRLIVAGLASSNDQQAA